MKEYETLTTEIHGNVFSIGLNRPEKYNSFNIKMLRELSLALAEVGPAVAKGDLLFPEASVDPLDLFHNLRTKPVVCAVQGWCLTIGIELLLATDVRIASETTTFSQMEVNRGIMPFGGATIRFPQVAGWGNAMYHLLTGDKFDSTEALRIGLVQEVVAANCQQQRGLEIAQLIASRAPLAVQETRRNARLALENHPSDLLESLMVSTRKLMATEDAMEGVRSFIERREAKFSGK